MRSGRLGELRLIHSAFTFRLTRPDNIRLRPELGGGSLMDVGCYCVNLSRTVAGAEPVAVQALARWSQSGVDDQMAGTLQFAGGLVAQFDCALTLERREVYELAGTEAHLAVPDAFLPGEEDVSIVETRARGSHEQHVIPGIDEYRRMVEHFSDCIVHDQPPRYPVSEAAANMRAIEALYRSARAGGRVETL